MLLGTAGALIAARAAEAGSVYVALGDSITFGETDLRYIPSFGDRGYVGDFADVLASRRGGNRPDVVNLAIDGETAASFMSGVGRTPPVVGRTDAILAAQNLNYDPDALVAQSALFASTVASRRADGDRIDTVSITLGFNELAALAVLPEAEALAMVDATLTAYRDNYEAVLGQVRSLLPEAHLYLLNYYNPFPADPAMNTADAVFAAGGPRLNAIIEDLAAEFGASYVDTFTPFVGREAEYTFIDEFPAGSIVPEPHPFGPGIAPIGNVHPNATGYRVIASQLAAVPEPSSLALLGTGAAFVIGSIWSRSRRRRLDA